MATIKELTQEQLQGALHAKGHALVRAVAGSGKSEMLLHRIANLLQAGILAEDILVLMFNTEAAEQFRQRLVLLLPNQELPLVATFHAFAFHYSSKRISDEESILEALKPCVLRENKRRALLDLPLLGTAPYALQRLYQRFDFLRNTREEPPKEEIDFFNDVLSVFQKRHLSDFTDLLIAAEKTFKKEGAPHYTHIMVDEYQDVNRLQQDFLDTLIYPDTQLMVVGDEDQCIYEWRGSNPDLMLTQFEKNYTPVTTYVLSSTFRYGHSIALCANHLLQHNKSRIRKQVISAKKEETEILFNKSLDKVIDSINNETDTAILLRTYQRVAELELTLRLKNKPYRLIGSLSLENSVLGAFLRAVLSNTAFTEDVWLLFFGENVPEWMLTHFNNENDPVLALGKIRRDSKIGGLWLTKVEEAYTVLRKLYSKMDWLLPELLETLSEYSYNRALKRLCTYLMNQPNLTTEVLLELVNTPSKNEGITICSMHRAKGGGWSTVVLPWWDDQQFPMKNSDEESERRLAYVAITRAKQQLILHAETEWHPHFNQNEPISVFVKEMDLDHSVKWAYYFHDQKKNCPTQQTSVVRHYLQTLGLNKPAWMQLKNLQI